MRLPLNFPGSPQTPNITHATGAGPEGHTTSHSIAQVPRYDTSGAGSVFGGYGNAFELGDVYGGNGTFMNFYDPYAFNALQQGWHTMARGSAVYLPMLFDQNVAPAAGLNPEEDDWASYIDWEGGQSDLGSLAATESGQEGHSGSQSSRPLWNQDHAHTNIHGDSLVPTRAPVDTHGSDAYDEAGGSIAPPQSFEAVTNIVPRALNDSMASRAFSEPLAQTKADSVSDSNCDSKGPVAATDANATWPSDGPKDVILGLNNMRETPSSSTGSSPSVTDLSSFGTVSRGDSPATPALSTKSPNMEPTPFSLEPAHSATLAQLPAPNSSDASPPRTSAAAFPATVASLPSSSKRQRVTRRSPAPQAGPSRKRAASHSGQDDVAHGPSEPKRGRYASTTPPLVTNADGVMSMAGPSTDRAQHGRKSPATSEQQSSNQYSFTFRYPHPSGAQPADHGVPAPVPDMRGQQARMHAHGENQQDFTVPATVAEVKAPYPGTMNASYAPGPVASGSGAGPHQNAGQSAAEMGASVPAQHSHAWPSGGASQHAAIATATVKAKKSASKKPGNSTKKRREVIKIDQSITRDGQLCQRLEKDLAICPLPDCTASVDKLTYRSHVTNKHGAFLATTQNKCPFTDPCKLKTRGKSCQAENLARHICDAHWPITEQFLCGCGSFVDRFEHQDCDKFDTLNAWVVREPKYHAE